MMKKRLQSYYGLTLAYQLGFSIAVPLIIFIGGGAWLDKRLGSTPVFTLLGLVLGFLISAISTYNQLKPLMTKNKPSKHRPPKPLQ